MSSLPPNCHVEIDIEALYLRYSSIYLMGANDLLAFFKRRYPQAEKLAEVLEEFVKLQDQKATARFRARNKPCVES
jgi:hypothetical protein